MLRDIREYVRDFREWSAEWWEERHRSYDGLPVDMSAAIVAQRHQNALLAQILEQRTKDIEPRTVLKND